MRFPAKITSSYILLPYLLIELCHIGLPVVPTNGRSGGRAFSQVISKFPRMGRLLQFLTHGAPLRVLRARELRYGENPTEIDFCSSLLEI